MQYRKSRKALAAKSVFLKAEALRKTRKTERFSSVSDSHETRIKRKKSTINADVTSAFKTFSNVFESVITSEV
jgi:hypothetical protein